MTAMKSENGDQLRWCMVVFAGTFAALFHVYSMYSSYKKTEGFNSTCVDKGGVVYVHTQEGEDEISCIHPDSIKHVNLEED